MKIAVVPVLAAVLAVAAHSPDLFARSFERNPVATSPTAVRLLRWMEANRHPDFSLPFSHVGDPELKDFIILYDAAVAAMAYLVMDRTDDATAILDYYLNDPQASRLGGYIEVFKLNPYFSGVDYSVRMGANLWMGLAAFHAYRKTGESRFLGMARRQADLALAIQVTNPSSPNFGGVPLGPKGDPDFETDQRISFQKNLPEYISIFSTEINLDSLALLSQLARETKDERYRVAAQNVFVWIRNNAYNSAEKRFNRGYRDPVVATDVQSWGVSALGLKTLDSLEPDLALKMLEFAESNCVSTVDFQRPDGTTVSVTGADFIDREQARGLGRVPLVSPEWTFQLVNAYGRIVSDLGKAGREREAARYEKRQRELLDSILRMALDSDGGLAFPYATLGKARIGHEHRTPARGNLSVIGNSYGILVLMGFDPLNPED